MGIKSKSELRVIDTGVADARLNIAFGQALVEQHVAGNVPDTLRFLRFPPCAIIGRHQAISHEVNLRHCERHGIELARRITGGGAIFLDPGQLGWELAVSRKQLGASSLGDAARKICEAAAKGLSSLGPDVRYRPRNDLEVDGRKISGTGGFFDGDTLFFQGTVLVDLNAAEMVAALNVPAAKLAKRDLKSAGSRIVTLRELLGTATPEMATVQDALLDGIAGELGLITLFEDFSAAEELAAKEFHENKIGRDAFVFEIDDPTFGGDVRTGTHTGPGGTVTAHVRLEGRQQDLIREVILTGDFFVTPSRVVFDLEAQLRRIPISQLDQTIAAFFARTRPDLLSVSHLDFGAAIKAALQ